MGVANNGLGKNLLFTKLDRAIGWARKYSIFQYPFVTACCGMEYMSVACSHFDIDRFGAGFPRFSPRQADLLMVVGTISHKIAPTLLLGCPAAASAAGHSLLGAFAGAGVCTGALAAHREAAAMAQAAIAANLHQALYVHLHVAAQIAFHLNVLVNVFAQFGDLVVSKILYARRWAHACFPQDFLGSR